MLKIRYKARFIRQYKKLPEALQGEVKEKIALFCKDPRNPSLRAHKLSGELKGSSSFSVNYQYRIVYFFESPKKVAFLAVGDHDVYK
jgi:addiction module RelE/StbE family toxin